MRSVLLSPKQYRDFASQCLRWAGHAKREEHKNMMLQMADHWNQKAQELERTGRSQWDPSRGSLSVPPPDGVESVEQQS
jgi:hypothetical protein